MFFIFKFLVKIFSNIQKFMFVETAKSIAFLKFCLLAKTLSFAVRLFSKTFGDP